MKKGSVVLIVGSLALVIVMLFLLLGGGRIEGSMSQENGYQDTSRFILTGLDKVGLLRIQSIQDTYTGKKYLVFINRYSNNNFGVGVIEEKE